MTSTVVASPRLKVIQRSTLAMLVVSIAISTIDRAALAVANPLIRHDLGLSIAEMGMLLSAFLWAYAFSQLPIGALIDRFGPRWLLGCGLAVWSSAQLLCGLVTNTAQFAAARALLGIGEAPQFPAAARVVKDWFAVRDRGSATGIFMCASYLGTGLAAPLLTAMMLSFGWRWMFMTMGILGLVMSAVWFAIYRNPSQIALTEDEHHYLGVGEATLSGEKRGLSLAQWRSLFRSSTTWGLVIGYFGVIYVNWLFNTWLPGYLHMARHMSLAQVGWTAAIPYTFAVLGALVAGYLTDWLARKGMSLTHSRKVPACIFLVAQTLFVVVAALVPDNNVAVACLSGALFCGTAATTIAWAMISVFSPQRCTGSLGALQNFGGYMGGSLAPIVTGLIVQKTGTFVPALYLGAGMSLFAALAYLVLIRGPVTLRVSEEAEDNPERISPATTPVPPHGKS
ncbi:sugar phosphate permease [Paraburkholderia sp. EB58]|jgi:sugar phosphate permease|uniref:MFS transporter n=1 Tax=Paraburkholderia sp. EB58 TaxID=3035125 RepID=UPI003D251921